MVTTFMVIYFALIVVVGYFASRRVKTADDFLIGGRKFGLLPLASTNLATMLGGGGIVGLVGAAYSGGFAHPFWYVVGLGIFGWWATGFLWAKPFRRLGLTTVPQALGEWYGPEVRTVCALVNVLATALVTSSQLLAGASVVKAISGISFDLSYYLASAVIIAYTMAGGLVAVVWTDLVQTAILGVGLIVAAVGILSSTGGWQGLLAMPAIKPSDLSVFAIAPMAIVGYVLSNFLNSPTDQVGIIRVFSARDESAARGGCVLGAGVYLPYILVAGIIGLAARNLHPGIAPNTAFPTLVLGLFPPALGALMVVSALAIIMSTADSTLQATSSILTVDIYKGLFRREASDRDTLVASRWFVLAVGLFAMLAGKFYPSILGLIVFAFGMRGAAFFLPIVLKFANISITRQAAFWSSIVGCGTAIAWLLTGKPFGLDPVVPGVVLAAVCLLVVQLATARRVAA